MTEVTIAEIDSDRMWEPEGGRPMRIIECDIALPDGRIEHRRWIRQPGSEAVQMGDTLDVELFEKNGTARMRLAPKGAGNGHSPSTFRPRDVGGTPDTTREDRSHAIQWQHSQEMAIRYAAAYEKDASLARITELTKHFYSEIGNESGGSQRTTEPGTDTPPTVSTEEARDLYGEIMNGPVPEKDAHHKLIELGGEGTTLKSSLVALPADKLAEFKTWFYALQKALRESEPVEASPDDDIPF